MAKVDVYNMEGAVVGQMELSDAVFGIEPNEAVLHQVVKARCITVTRAPLLQKAEATSEDGGKRPYRQKAPVARQGSIRAAQWVGGGVVSGPNRVFIA